MDEIFNSIFSVMNVLCKLDITILNQILNIAIDISDMCYLKIEYLIVLVLL